MLKVENLLKSDNLIPTLNVEILLYGVKALIFGLPSGWLLSYSFYRWAYGASREAIPFRTPLLAVAVAIASILFVALIIMRYNNYKPYRGDGSPGRI